MDWPSQFDPALIRNQAQAAGLEDLLVRLADLKAGPGPGLDLLGLEGGARAFVLARLIEASKRSLLVVTPSLAAAESLAADLNFFLGPESKAGAAVFPSYAHLPFGHLPAHTWTVARRLSCLWRLISGDGPLAAVVPIQALLHRLPPVRVLNDFAELVLEGEEVDRQVLIAKLAAGGYAPTALVEEPGDMAIRGGIVDVFGPLHDEPLRLEFFGDFVDSLRLFKPHDQRSIRRLKESVILPMSEVILSPANLERGRQGLARLEAEPAQILALREPLIQGQPFAGIESFAPLFYEECQGLWDYLGREALVCLLEPGQVEEAGREYLARLTEHEQRLRVQQRPHLPLAAHACSFEEATQALAAFPRLAIQPLPLSGRSSLHFHGRPSRELLPPPQEEKESVLAPLVKTVRRLDGQGLSPWLVCRTQGQLKRLSELLAGYGLSLDLAAAPPTGLEPSGPEQLRLVQGALSAGFFLPGPGLVVLTEEEALGQLQLKSAARAPSPLPTARLASYAELSPGDLVVHEEHGIGQFVSLINLVVNEQMGDYLFLEYKGGDKLYVPADRLNLIHKYAGPEGKRPPLDRLGGETWRKTKSRVKRRLLEIAQDLIDLYAVRQIKEGHAFTGRDELLREFEATFDFEETPDQAAAVEDVLRDMQRSRPMDRLVCGDVGYGKTEVALRAAFRAVMDGSQVALLVPTTVLAEQHAETFSQRLKPYPVRVEVLSRFKTASAQKKILADLAGGQVDVVIGTHRLLSKDVAFKHLGLVIVDEEHRFGVGHKEKLKQLRQTVDVLALTATPIPRTLQMSLLGIRDLSVINTPPEHRQAITTYLSAFDPAAVQEAIGREIGRSGQVFFVHNRVQDINRVANLVQKLVPTARVEVAHGQMSERVLEKVMFKFVQRQVDVLVCTTIIESGLDIPSANTIIINEADKLGLAQIYQLRGRVGRSSERAYAYLLIPTETTLTRDAQKRLKVLMDFTHLGAGFKIAMHDLQIRGGGNLLGHAQSGQIAAVGYETYLNLMEQAVAELRGQPRLERVDPEIHLAASALLPEDYVADANQRLLFYRRLAGVEEEAELADLLAEMTDRFGQPPQEALNLVEAIRLKLELRRAGVARLDAFDGRAVLTFVARPPLDARELLKLVRQSPKRLRLTPENRLIITAPEPLAEARRLLPRLIAA